MHSWSINALDYEHGYVVDHQMIWVLEMMRAYEGDRLTEEIEVFDSPKRQQEENNRT